MMRAGRVLLGCIVLLAASSAWADITPISHFTGDVSETFETIPFSTYTGPIEVFGGVATMDDTFAHVVVVSWIWTGPWGEVTPYAGGSMGGSPLGSILFEFAEPIAQFGGYFTTNSADPDGTVVFRDEAGEEIDSLDMRINLLTWAWQGWSSDVPVYSVEVIGNYAAGPPGSGAPAGGLVQMDNLELTWVPEPGALALVLVGAALLGSRRR